MPDEPVSVAEADRELAGSEDGVPLETVRDRLGASSLAMELARAREEVGRLNGQLEEVRAQNARLREELKDSATELRRLAAEVLDLRAAAEERLMERIEHIAYVEKEPAESSSPAS